MNLAHTVRRARVAAPLLLVAALSPACGEAPAPAPGPAVAVVPAAPPKVPAAAAEAPSATAPTLPKGAALPLPEVLSDAWYEQISGGDKVGWYHMVWTVSERGGEPTIHDRTESYSGSRRQMGPVEDVFEARTVTDLERREDGSLLWMRVETRESGRVSTSEITWTGTGYELVEDVGGVTRTRSLACPEPVPVDTEAFLYPRVRSGELGVGQRLGFRRANFDGQRLDDVELVVTGREEVPVPGGRAECYRVEEAVRGTPLRQTWWIDDRGVLCRVRTGDYQVVRSSARVASVMPAEPMAYTITVPAEPKLPRATSLDRAVVEIELEPREHLELPDFPDTPFSREIGREGNRIRLELLAHHGRGIGTETTLPLEDPSLLRWLESTPLLCADHPRVQAEMRRAIGDERDAREVARKLLRHVFLTLDKQSAPVPDATALEIVEQGGGDCSEHCVLFVALCRAAGLPARRLTGYAQVGDLWGAHAFAEVWLGEWVGADPTTNELGTQARYVCFGWNDDPDSFPGVVSGRVRGRMSIRTLEFEDRGRRYVVDDLEPASPREDPFSGLAFATPPEGWTAFARNGTGTGTVRGPGVSARITVHAGMGDLTADMLRDYLSPGGEVIGFGARSACRMSPRGAPSLRLLVPCRRRFLEIQASLGDGADAAATLATLANLLEPSF